MAISASIRRWRRFAASTGKASCSSFRPATTRYRDRSHFDGQNLLENGSGIPFGAKDGWLNRAIVGLDQGDRRMGLALGPAVPLLLHGPAPGRHLGRQPAAEDR